MKIALHKGSTVWIVDADSFEEAFARHGPADHAQRLRQCLDCGHWSCPFCEDWCDRMLDDEDGDPSVMCCDGECRYVAD